MGGILRDNLGEGNCESKIAARQWGVNFCREASRCLAGPSGLAASWKKWSVNELLIAKKRFTLNSLGWAA